MSVKKKIIICATILFSILIIVNIVWYVGVWSKYAHCLEQIETRTEEGKTDNNCYVDEKYRISIKKPSYLNFSSGCISISNAEYYTITQLEDGTMVANKEYDVGIYIWPELKGGYEIGVHILEGVESTELRYYVDKDLKYIPNSNVDIVYNEEAQEKIDKYYNDLREMLDFAVEILDIEL